jgi:N-acetylglucosaminyl-diphospho-decaprenol L-rhamnosyltransferase
MTGVGEALGQDIPAELSVVVVSYNTRELLHRCLVSVVAECERVAIEVVVVDNASEDGSAAMVTADFPAVRLLASPDNLGFARGCNVGVGASKGDWVVLLNPDTVVQAGALERLLAFAKAHPEAGLCGGRTLRPDGSVDPSSCWGSSSIWSLACYSLGLSTLLRRSRWFDPESLGRWERDSVREVGVVTGCLLACSRTVWDDLGGFDERFWMYGEDADLSARAWRRGYRPMITPEATITHVVGASSPSGARKRRMVLAGKVTLLNKNWSPARARIGRTLLAGGVHVRALGARAMRVRSSPWPEVWRDRGTWREGWPAIDAPIEISPVEADGPSRSSWISPTGSA